MLQRRSFLGALLGLAATPVLARLLPPPSLILPETALVETPIIMQTLEVPRGVGVLRGILATLDDSVWTPQGFQLLRADGARLIEHWVARGGMLMHPLHDPHGIVFTPDAPLVLDVPKHMDFQIMYEMNGEHCTRRWIGGVMSYDVPMMR